MYCPAEVTQFDYSVLNDNILWFDVPVHNVETLHVEDSLTELFGDGSCIGLGNLGLVLEDVVELAAGEEFQ